MGQIVIAQLPVKDWQKFKEIRLEALKTNPTAFSNTYEDIAKYPDEKWQKQMKQSEKKDENYFLFAFDGDKVIGMNGAYWTNKPVTKHIAEVFGVFVNPAYRGQGIGKRLMDEIITEIKKNPQFKKIKLGVNAENIQALKLYLSCGLKVVGRLEKELKFGDKYCDELLLEMLI